MAGNVLGLPALLGTAIPHKQSGQVTSEQKMIWALGSHTLSGPPAPGVSPTGTTLEPLLRCWAPLHRHSGDEGSQVAGL